MNAMPPHACKEAAKTEESNRCAATRLLVMLSFVYFVHYLVRCRLAAAAALARSGFPLTLLPAPCAALGRLLPPAPPAFIPLLPRFTPPTPAAPVCPAVNVECRLPGPPLMGEALGGGAALACLKLVIGGSGNGRDPSVVLRWGV